VPYRDDADALYLRATALQRELDQARRLLAQRDSELAKLRDAPSLVRARRDPVKARPAARTDSTQLPRRERLAVIAKSRELLAHLDDERLLVLGALLETVSEPGDAGNAVYVRLRWLISAASRLGA